MSAEEETPFSIDPSDDKNNSDLAKKKLIRIIIIVVTLLVVVGVIVLVVCLKSGDKDWPEDKSTNYITALYTCPESQECRLYNDLTVNHTTEISSITINNKRTAVEPNKTFSDDKNLSKTVVIRFNQKVSDMSFFFFDVEHLLTVDFTNFDTSELTVMSSMFRACLNLKSITWGPNFSTSKVTKMDNLFNSCTSYPSTIDVSKFDTSKVQDFSYMFSHCENIQMLNLKNFDTSSSKVISGMFQSCEGLTSLDLSSFNTKLVEVMNNMFKDCSSLKNVIQHFTSEKLQITQRMFEGCVKLESIDLSGMDGNAITDMSYMFFECNALSSIDLSNFSGQGANDVRNVFYGLPSEGILTYNSSKLNPKILESLTASNYTKNDSEQTPIPQPDDDDKDWPDDPSTNYISATYTCPEYVECRLYNDRIVNHTEEISSISVDDKRTAVEPKKVFSDGETKTVVIKFNQKVSDMNSFFFDAAYLLIVDFTNFDTSELTVMSSMFKACLALKSITWGPNFSTSKVTKMDSLFNSLSTYPFTIDVSKFDTSKVQDFSYMFIHCDAIKLLNLKNFDTSSAIDTSGMFQGCEGLVSLDLSSFDTSNVLEMSDMFAHCYNLTSLTVKFDTSKVTYMNAMFSSCSSLATLDLSSFVTSSVTVMDNMFKNCLALKNVIQTFTSEKLERTQGMFAGCAKLESIDLSGMDGNAMIDMKNMFNGCRSLTSIDLSKFSGKNATDVKKAFYGISSNGTLIYDSSKMNELILASLPDTYTKVDVKA